MNSQLHIKIGVLEAMLLLQELHRQGYQKLRWYSYMAPNGLHLRCHITTEDNLMYSNGRIEIKDLDEEKAWWTSFNEVTSGIDIKIVIDELKRDISNFVEKGNGEDEEYVKWFEKLVEEAKNGYFPEYQAEFVKFPPYTVLVNREFIKIPVPFQIRDDYIDEHVLKS